MGRVDPERKYRKRYSEIEVRRGDKEIRFRIGTDRNGVRMGSDTPWTCGVHEWRCSPKMIIQVTTQLLMLGHQPKVHLALRLHFLIRKD